MTCCLLHSIYVFNLERRWTSKYVCIKLHGRRLIYSIYSFQISQPIYPPWLKCCLTTAIFRWQSLIKENLPLGIHQNLKIKQARQDETYVRTGNEEPESEMRNNNAVSSFQDIFCWEHVQFGQSRNILFSSFIYLLAFTVIRTATML